MEIGELDVRLRRRQHIDRALGRQPRLPRNLRQLGARGAVTRPGSAGSQRTLVKVMAVGGRGTRQHLAYLQHEKGPQRTPAVLYGPGAQDPRAFAQAAHRDPRQFRLIISTREDPLGAQRTAFIEALVRQMERDVGLPLDWVAANHYDRPHAHTHVVVRGAVHGEAWYMAKSYVTQGIRDRANALLARMLGQQQTAGLRYQHDQAYAQERLILNGMVRGTGDPDLTRLVRQQTVQTQTLGQMQQRLQALETQQRTWQHRMRREG